MDSPLIHLGLASMLLVLTHIVPGWPRLRAWLVAYLGKRGYLVSYSVLSFILIAWMVAEFVQAPRVELWQTSDVMRKLPLFVMPIAFVIMFGGYFNKNPTVLGQSKLLAQEHAARGMIRVTRHPAMWGYGLWAGVHMIANGDVASLLFFGGFFVLALGGALALDHKKALRHGADWQRFVAKTSFIPFVAILQGRNKLDVREIGLLPLAAGMIAYALFIYYHPALFGAQPY